MLTFKKNIEIYEAISEVDGQTVMTFTAAIDRQNPANSSFEVGKESEFVYRKYRDQASDDRQEFEKLIFSRIDELENPRHVDAPVIGEPEVIDGDYVNVEDEEVTDDAEN